MPTSAVLARCFNQGCDIISNLRVTRNDDIDAARARAARAIIQRMHLRQAAQVRPYPGFYQVYHKLDGTAKRQLECNER